MARRLLAAGAHIDASGPAGGSRLDPALREATPLAVALVRERFEVAQALVELGAQPNHADPLGRTPLVLALLFGRESAVRWLIDHGAQLEPPPDSQGRTPRTLAERYPEQPASRAFLSAPLRK